MKWNASAVAALLLLAGCGGDRGYANYGPEVTGPPPGSVAAQSWGSRRMPTAAPAPADAPPESVDAPPIASEPPYAPQAAAPADIADAAPGAPYAAPVAGDPAPRLAYAPPPTQEANADPAAAADGPRGSSQRRLGEERYDEVGYAGVRTLPDGAAADDGIVALHRSLAPDTLVEVTSLDSGRTIVVLVTGAADPGAGNAIELSAGAARLLGQDGNGPIPVRVRKVTAGPGDMMALRAGRPAAPRPDTPPVLLNALRKHLPALAAAPAPAAPPRPAYARPVASRPAPRTAPVAARGGYYVQVAALSNARNAQVLAKSLRGSVKQGGGFHRVQLGPFATRREADAARAGAARAGYGDARVFAVN
jgi:rare lipoprotein A